MKIETIKHSQLLVILLVIAAQAVWPALADPDLLMPRNFEPWTQDYPRHAEIPGGNFHGAVKDSIVPVAGDNPKNMEPKWQQLERSLRPATAEQRANITMKTTKLFRYIGFNNLPDSSLAALPPIANPGAAKSNAYIVRMTLTPEYKDSPPGRLHISKIPFGIALNGVLINRGNNDYWKIHNHSISLEILKNLRQNKKPTLIGYAADGYPIYGPYGYKQADNQKSPLVELKASFKIKENIPSKNRGPKVGTSTDTTGSAKELTNGHEVTKPIPMYQFIEKLGDLDDYNGRFGVTPEYPDGTYYYVISNSFPYIPISFRGVPDKTFVPPKVELPLPLAPFHKLFNPSRPNFDF